MKIHEYQGKHIFARYGVPVPMGEPAFSVNDVVPIAQRIMEQTKNPIVVMKAQIHAGGRGKGGGVKIIKNDPHEARTVAEKMLDSHLITKQTGPAGQLVRRLLIEQGLDIDRELYFAMLVDREHRRVAVIASTEGGMDIEEVAQNHPDKIVKIHIDPFLGLAPYQARQLALELGLVKDIQRQFCKMAADLYSCFISEDCSLLEINPLIVTKTGDLIALDAKITFDDNAEFRHRDLWEGLRDPDEEDPIELEARRAGLSYVSLDGDIGCLVNGAGLAMATMDIILHHGGQPANFLDVGGGASEQQVKTAFQIILRSERVKGIFVNIFGGIMRCDIVASGIISATKELGLKVPLVVRLEGTNVEAGRKLLDESGLTIQSATSMGDGAQKIVAAIKATPTGK